MLFFRDSTSHRKHWGERGSDVTHCPACPGFKGHKSQTKCCLSRTLNTHIHVHKHMHTHRAHIHRHTHRHTQDNTHGHTGTHTGIQTHTQTHTGTHSSKHKQTQTHRGTKMHTHRHTGLWASSYETVSVCPTSRLVLQPPSCRVSSLEAREPCPGTVSALCRVAGGLQKSITPKDHRVAAWTPEWPNTWITPKRGVPCRQPVCTTPSYDITPSVHVLIHHHSPRCKPFPDLHCLYLATCV